MCNDHRHLLISKIVLTMAVVAFGQGLRLSFVLSGHIFLGVGYEQHIANNQQLTIDYYLVPEKGLPYAVGLGLQQNFMGVSWQAQMGFRYVLMASPDIEGTRTYLSILNFEPGALYAKDKFNQYQGRLWLSLFLSEANKTFAPTGLEFSARRKL